MPTLADEQVQKLSDTRRPGFAEECSRQSLLVALADAADDQLETFIDAAFADLDDESNSFQRTADSTL